MAREHAPNRQYAELLKSLCEAELADDSMICHDGGYRFAGDFMSMEEGLAPPAIVDDEIYRSLLSEGYIEEVEPALGRSGGFRVTELGRQLAYSI